MKLGLTLAGTLALCAVAPDAMAQTSDVGEDSFWSDTETSEVQAQEDFWSTSSADEVEAQRAAIVEQRRLAEAQRRADEQRQAQLAQAERERRKKSGFSLGKALALGTGAILGGAADLDVASQAKLVGGILADSMGGAEGASNMIGAMNGIVAEKVANTRGGSSDGGGASGSYSGPVLPNILNSGRGNCSDNQQVSSMCQVADAYYNRYVQVANEGSIDPSQLYDAHKLAAKEAMRYMQNAQVDTALVE